MSSFRKAQLQKQPVASLSTTPTHGRGPSLTVSAEFGSMPEPQPTGTNFGTHRQSLSEQRPRQAFGDNRSRPTSEYGVSRPITPAAPQEPHLRHKDRWLEAARESTEHFKKHGSPLPLVWVLVEDNNIPPNAVPFGEDRNGTPLYIARALLEGGLHLGKAGQQFSGAVIGYAGKERIMTKYEVLVCASQLRWGFPSHEPNGVLAQGTVILAQQYKEDHHHQRPGFANARNPTEVESLNTTLYHSDIPRYIPDGFVLEPPPDREAGLRKLAEIKTVVLIDDSISMAEGDLWAQAREALAGIVDIANKYGSKGTDIHFMHQDVYGPNMQSKSYSTKLSPKACEDTPTALKLNQLIEHYLPLIERKGSAHEPITIIVITDGVATDQEDLERHIVDTAHRLDRNGVREDMFGIQFVQIGTDEAAAEVLHALDDHLVDHYKIRDIVDSTPFNPEQGAFDTEYMIKILLGSLHKDLDNAPPNTGVTSTLLSPLGGTGHTSSPRHGPAGYDRSPRGISTNLRLAGPSPRGTTLKTLPRPGY
ncbi:hypothetical protein HYDPIDRAFT_31547 [Hydnomerulius pinastri MD-312]|uniref:VWFA domain-containing protein n=1 Tax=Hydnomerulius pinastri MD-312 TaxID=994086 RepID=A0A0C9VTG4_9AGAM|nr:hypothetical protein HYDPIDRAFT_31547 [Hydnomerulius pinastri MD-312]